MDLSIEQEKNLGTEYRARFGVLPDGVARMAANNGTWDAMIAAMQEAVVTGSEPTDWTSIVWPRVPLFPEDEYPPEATDVVPFCANCREAIEREPEKARLILEQCIFETKVTDSVPGTALSWD